MQRKFIPESDLSEFLAGVCAGRTVYGMSTVDGNVRLSRLEASDAELPPHRAVEPLKTLFFRLRQDVGGFFDDSEDPQAAPRAVIGVTPCDLASLEVLDHVFLEGDFVDPFYQALRKNTLIVSTDCTDPAEHCFCTLVGGKPYAEKGFDVNLAPVDAGFIAESATETGDGLIEKFAGGREPSADEIEAVNARRRGLSDQLDARLDGGKLGDAEAFQERVRESRHDPLWEQLAEKCVECGACNFVCPTCHCFFLLDLENSHGFKRFRNWDACLYAAFAREASGANPRARRADRLHGRVEKKFDFIRTNTGRWGCVGCGRCIEACAGKIDMRETLMELANA